MAKRSAHGPTFAGGAKRFTAGMTNGPDAVEGYLSRPVEVLAIGQVANVTELSALSLGKLIDEGTFPAARQFGANPGKRGWSREMVNKWLTGNGKQQTEDPYSRNLLERMRAVVRPYAGKETDALLKALLDQMGWGQVEEGLLKKSYKALQRYQRQKKSEQLSERYRLTDDLGAMLMQFEDICTYLSRALKRR